jgi:hypothetical protein
MIEQVHPQGAMTWHVGAGQVPDGTVLVALHPDVKLTKGFVMRCDVKPQII